MALSRRRAVALGGLAAALVAAVPAAGAVRTFADPAGDAGAGFDITSVSVTNDRAGTLTFRIAMPAVAALPDNMAVSLVVDTDLKNEADPIDYGILAVRGRALLFPPSGQPFIPRSLRTSFVPGEVTIAVNHKDLGGVHKLLASAVSFTIGPDGSLVTDKDTDLAPDAGVVTYALTLPTKLKLRSSALSPSRPAAGSRFRAGLFVRDVTFGTPGEPVSGGRVTCRFTVGGRPAGAIRSVDAGGRATCHVSVPAGTSGQAIRGTVKYTLGGASVTRTFTGTVA